MSFPKVPLLKWILFWLVVMLAALNILALAAFIVYGVYCDTPGTADVFINQCLED